MRAILVGLIVVVGLAAIILLAIQFAHDLGAL